MFFSKKKDKQIKCEVCSSKLNDKYSYCPYCGSDLLDNEKELKNFGMLGRNDFNTKEIMDDSPKFGFTDKLISSLMNSLMKNIDEQFREIEKTEVKTLPNGIRIKIGVPQVREENPPRKKTSKLISQEQLEKMSSFPRTSAKANVRRLSDKVVYELNTPGLNSVQDVFVSRTESGYEIKAIGSNKVYVNNLSIDLPLKGFSVSDNKLLIEFKTDE